MLKLELPGMPVNLELERAFLANAIFGTKGRDRLDELAEIIKPEYFADPMFGLIWSAATRCTLTSEVLTAEGLARLIADAEGKAGGDVRARIAELACVTGNLAPALYTKQIRAYHMRRKLMELGQEIIADAATDDPERSAADRMEYAEAALYGLGEEYTGLSFSGMTEGVNEAVAMIDRAQKAKDGVSGVPTGLTALDRRLGGLQPGELTIAAGRPGMGKTALGLTVARNAALAGHRVALFSLEMSKGALCQRFLAQETGISVQAQRTDSSTAAWRAIGEARQRLDALPILIDDSGRGTVAHIRAMCRRAKRRGGLGLIIVDYLGLMQSADPKANKVHQIEEMTGGLKRLSKELAVPVLLLCQLSRGVEHRDEKRPGLADLRDSGAIEQDADVVIFLYREHYYLSKMPVPPDKAFEHAMKVEDLKHLAELIVAKFRQGEAGTDRVRWDGARQLFSDLFGEGGQ